MCGYCVTLFTCFSEDSELVSTSDSSDSSENASLFSSETSRKKIMFIRIKKKTVLLACTKRKRQFPYLVWQIGFTPNLAVNLIIEYYAFLKKDIKNKKRHGKCFVTTQINNTVWYRFKVFPKLICILVGKNKCENSRTVMKFMTSNLTKWRCTPQINCINLKKKNILMTRYIK